jgi:hypothetical protein
MMTTELDTTMLSALEQAQELDMAIAGVEATLSAREQAHARQVGVLHKELAALTAQRWLVHPSVPLQWSPWIPQPNGVRPHLT